MVRISHALLLGFVAVCLTSMLAFVGGWRMSQAFSSEATAGLLTPGMPGVAGSDPPASADVQGDFSVFWEAWGLVFEEFYHKEPLNQQNMVYGATRGMLQSLGDEYTAFQEPVAAERTRESMRGSFEGIGIMIRLKDGMIIVSHPMRKSPAQAAGVQRNDVLVKIDGEDVATMIQGLDEGKALDTISEKIRGTKGSSVRLTLRRPPETTTFDLDIVRDVVPLISVNAQMLEGNVAYIQITEFREPTPQEFDEALRQLLPQQPVGLILDLRNNPGGVLPASMEVLGRFYEGVGLYEEDSKGTFKPLETIVGDDDVRIQNLPLVVLINERSASAAEIVAGALRERYPNTTLIGATSFGKGSVQNVHQLSDGSSARITVAHWFTPEKHEIHHVGIAPDYAVQPSQDSAYAMPCFGDTVPADGQDSCPDGQLVHTVRFLTTHELPPTPEPTPVP